MYYFKKDKAEMIKKKYKLQYIAETAGLSLTYLSLILNCKKSCPKKTAYVITKVINCEEEIETYFDIVK